MYIIMTIENLKLKKRPNFYSKIKLIDIILGILFIMLIILGILYESLKEIFV